MSRRKDKLKRLQAQVRVLEAKSSPPDPTTATPIAGGPRQIIEQLVSMSGSMRAEHYSGPLPPPQMLEEYNKVVPGFADRIMLMAEKQLDHRQKLESTVINSRIGSERLGTHYAFALAVLFGAGAIYLLERGHGTAGIALLIGDITALVGIFIVGRYMQKKENQDKIKALTQTPQKSR